MSVVRHASCIYVALLWFHLGEALQSPQPSKVVDRSCNNAALHDTGKSYTENTAGSDGGDVITFGRHRPPLPHDQSDVVERTEWPSPSTFNAKHDAPRIPLIVRGGASAPSTTTWTDEHLKQAYGATEVYAEVGKLEDRQNNGVHLPLSDFIDRYKEEDL